MLLREDPGLTPLQSKLNVLAGEWPDPMLCP